MPLQSPPRRTSSMKQSGPHAEKASIKPAALDFSQLLLELEETHDQLEKSRNQASTASNSLPPNSPLPKDPSFDDDNAIFTGSESGGSHASSSEPDLSSTEEESDYLNLTLSYQHSTPVKKIAFSDVNEVYSADEAQYDSQDEDEEESPKDVDLLEDDVLSFDSTMAQVDTAVANISLHNPRNVEQPTNFLEISLGNHATFDDIIGKLDNYINRRRTKDYEKSPIMSSHSSAMETINVQSSKPSLQWESLVTKSPIKENSSSLVKQAAPAVPLPLKSSSETFPSSPQHSLKPEISQPPSPFAAPIIKPRIQSRTSAESNILEVRRRKMDSMLEKMGDCEIKRITSKIYVGDATTFKTVVVSSLMTADYIVADMVASMHLEPSNQWCLFELCNDFNIERPIRDWEVVVDIMSSWDPAESLNAIVMKKYSLKDSVSPGSLIGKYPKIQGWIYFEQRPGKWQKRFFFLKDTVLCYYRDSSSDSDAVYCHISNFDVYTLIAKHKRKLPTNYCFALRSTSPLSFFQTKTDYIKYLCVEKSERLFDWVLAIRLAKNEDMFQNHSDMFDDYKSVMSEKAWKRMLRRNKQKSPPSQRTSVTDDEPLIKLRVHPPQSRDYQKGSGTKKSETLDRTSTVRGKGDMDELRRKKETRTDRVHRPEDDLKRTKPQASDASHRMRSERATRSTNRRRERRTKETERDSEREIRRREASRSSNKPEVGWLPPKPLVDMRELRNSSCLKCGCSETRTYNSGLCINCYHIHATGESGI